MLLYEEENKQKKIKQVMTAITNKSDIESSLD